MLTTALLAVVGVAVVTALPTAHIVDIVNADPASTWTAVHNDAAETYPVNVPADYKEVHADRLPILRKEPKGAIPASFDAREKWPECKTTIGNIRDQSHCGSCWAVSSASVFSDRYCVATGGSKEVISYSADDVMSCCTGRCGNGCSGGYPGEAWNWLVGTGVVTGGNFTDKAGCKPYPFPPHGRGNYQTPRCSMDCMSDYKKAYKQDKAHAHSSFRVEKDVEQIQTHLLDGTLVATFAVYEDFYRYSHGVYKKQSGSLLEGYHAVRLIGWGEENGTPYWLIANSWDTNWGMDGYFKILRGQNECGIEEGIVGGEVKM